MGSLPAGVKTMPVLRSRELAGVLLLPALREAPPVGNVAPEFEGRSLSSAMEFLEGVHWVRVGAGKSVHEWTTRLSEVQKAILRSVGGTRHLPCI